MFWKFDLHTSSHIDKLLDKEDVTLRELMEEEDVLQECKAQNRRLLLFLSQDQCMRELVTLITQEPPQDMEERIRFKFPNIACELLTSDVSHINDKLGGDESLLETLYHFLDQEPPLNPLLASFFSKTIGNLITRKTEQVISFLRKKDGFIGLVLKHMDTSAMMDLVLRLISCVEPAPLRQEVLNWLNEERIIQRLMELIRAGRDEERQSNASQTLCDVIRLSRDQALQMHETGEPDPLLAVLESQETVEELLRNMFEGEKDEGCILSGTQVLLTLLETRRSGVEGLMDLCSQGFERSHTVNSSILHGMEPQLKDLHQLLLDPPKKSAILTTIGVLEEPLGNARLHIARLVASLLQTDTPSINRELCRLGTVDLLLDLFFKYTWNNFLHFQVELCVAAILNHSGQEEKPPPTLEKEEKQKEEASMEHAQNSAVETADASGHSILVAHAFSEYQIQQMTANFVDQFGFNDEEFAEHDENINATFDRIAEINFSLDADDTSANAAAFEACCKERIQQFDDKEEEEEDIWEDKEINYATQVKSRTRFGVSRTSDSSSRSDVENGEQDQSFGSDEEEAGPKDAATKVENNKNKPRLEGTEAQSTESPGWTADFGDTVNLTAPGPRVVVDVGASVWDSTPPQHNATESQDKGWATFSDFQPFCCSESGPRCSSPVGLETTGPKGCVKQAQDKNCEYNSIMLAPLVASDSSSSGGSDSEEEEEKVNVVTETVAASASKEAVKLAVEAKNEKANLTR
ncbi:hypothetical protein JZ751_028880 [Albula glossodonta]|uniref:Serine/threonine-protein phosphatase 6 regulatory subunit 2 n=1 Tax=Albula glossodonta TaxID=121402 RepID=A0A8T2NI15_9TELE|nr:hypothetical protein JZ751_028880 [Albula glossodonta]